MVRLLLRNPRINPSEYNNYALEKAIEHEDVHVMRFLLRDRRIRNPSQAIVFAAKHGKLNIIKLLLMDDNINQSIEHNDAICSATEHGHIEIVKILLNNLQP